MIPISQLQCSKGAEKNPLEKSFSQIFGDCKGLKFQGKQFFRIYFPFFFHGGGVGEGDERDGACYFFEEIICLLRSSRFFFLLKVDFQTTDNHKANRKLKKKCSPF